MLSALYVSLSFISLLSPPPFLFSGYLLLVFNFIAFVASLCPCFQLSCSSLSSLEPVLSLGACLSLHSVSQTPFLPPPRLSELPTDFMSPLVGLQFIEGWGRASPPWIRGGGSGFLHGVPQSSQKGQTAFWLPSVESPSEGPVLLWTSKSHLWAKRIIKTFSQTFEAAFQTASCQFPS